MPEYVIKRVFPNAETWLAKGNLWSRNPWQILHFATREHAENYLQVERDADPIHMRDAEIEEL